MFNEPIDIQDAIALLHSIPAEIVFYDNSHKVKFFNFLAHTKYSVEKYNGLDFQIGSSIFDCHRNEKSHQIIRESFNRLQNGEDMVLMAESKSQPGKKAYMIAVRNSEKKLLGYYEWFDL